VGLAKRLVAGRERVAGRAKRLVAGRWALRPAPGRAKRPDGVAWRWPQMVAGVAKRLERVAAMVGPP